MTRRFLFILQRYTLGILLIFISSVCSYTQPVNELGAPLVKSYSSKDYKGAPQVFGITQDTSGIVYFTGLGITEFDGDTWRKIPPIEVTTYAVMTGKDGKIYIGSTDDLGYLQADSIGQQRIVSLLHLIPEKDRNFGQVRQMAIIGDDIYFATRTGYLFRYDSKKETIRIWKREESIFNLGSVRDELYLDIRDFGLCKMEGDSIKLVNNGSFFKDLPIASVLPYKEDQLLIGTSDSGLFIYNGESAIPFSTEADDLLRSSIYRGIMLPKEQYAFATLGDGLVVIDESGKWIHHITKSNGLVDDVIISIFLDASDKLWVGSSSGFSQVELISPVSIFIEDENNNQIPAEDIKRLDGQLYVASAGINGILYFDKKGQGFRTINNFPQDQSFSLPIIDNKLIGLSSNEVFEISGINASQMLSGGGQTVQIFTAHQSKVDNNRVFLGMSSGLSLVEPSFPKWRIIEKINEIPENVGVRIFVEKVPGKLWLGTGDQGLWRMDYKSSTDNLDDFLIENVQSYSIGVDGIQLGSVVIYIIDDIVTFTGAGGIYTFDESNNRLISDDRFPLPDVPNNIQYVVLGENPDKDVYAHFTYNNGDVEIGKYKKLSNGKYEWDVNAFEKLPKEIMLSTTKIFAEEDGVVWIGGAESLIRYDMNQITSEVQFPTKIRSVELGQDSLLFSGHGLPNPPILEYINHDIRFGYISTNTNISGQNEYQTQLEGFDKKWSLWSTKMDKAYTNLPEGTYTFRVKGKAPSGQIATEASYSFKILPPWWRTWWAYLLYAVIGLGGIYTLIQWRTSQFKNRSLTLEKEVNDRTKDIQERIEELSVINSVQKGLVEKMDMNSIYSLVGEQLRELFNANTLVIRTFDLENDLEIFNYAVEKGEVLDIPDRPLDKFARHLVETKEPILVRSGFKDFIQKYSDDESLEGESPKSAVFCPMIVDDKVVGNVSLQNVDHEDAFSESDENLLGTLTNSMSIALENARLFARANQLLHISEQRAEELAIINKVQEGLVKQTEIQGIFQFVGESLRDIVDAQTVVISTFDHNEEVEYFNYASRGGEIFTIQPRPFDNWSRYIIEHKKQIIINENFKDYIHQYLNKDELKWVYPKSAIFMPITRGAQIVANVSLQNLDKENAYTESDVKLLETLVSSISIAIENARLFEETELQAAEMSTVNSVSQAMTSNLDLETLFTVIGDKLQELFEADIVYIAMLDRSTGIIDFPYQYGDKMPPLKFGEGLTSNIIVNKKSQLINKDVSLKSMELGIEQVGISATSYLGVPIFSGEEVLGVLSVQSTKKVGRFSDSDMHLLEIIAANVGIAIHNAQLFDEAEKARAQAEEASEAKGTFLSTVSHELRTPLTSVIGFTKIIKERLDERILPFVVSEEKKTVRAIRQVTQNLDIVISEGERLTNLINTVLDLAKIEAGRLDWNMESLPISAIINQATAATSALFDQKSLPLHLEIEENLPEILGDKDRLIQVMINLISNAVKFTDEGDISIKALSKNDSIQIGITDSGIGISEEDKPKVFEKFKQVGDTLTEKPKGTGLGLPICKEIVEYHGGRIWVESEFGKGSTFLFSIPVNMEETATVTEQIPTNKGELKETQLIQPQSNGHPIVNDNGQKTILIVDDEPGIRNLLRQEISEFGYDIKEAENGKVAIEIIRKKLPDLVILDVIMPVMNGFDVAAILKNDPKTQNIPIIVLSIVEDKQRVAQLGVDRYMTKPIDINLLMDNIRQLVWKNDNE